MTFWIFEAIFSTISQNKVMALSYRKKCFVPSWHYGHLLRKLFLVISMVYKLKMGNFDLYDIYDQKSLAT